MNLIIKAHAQPLALHSVLQFVVLLCTPPRPHSDCARFGLGKSLINNERQLRASTRSPTASEAITLLAGFKKENAGHAGQRNRTRGDACRLQWQNTPRGIGMMQKPEHADIESRVNFAQGFTRQSMPIGLEVNPKIPISALGQSDNAGIIANQIQDNKQEAVASNGGSVNQSNNQSQAFSLAPESSPSTSRKKSTPAPAPECIDFVDEPDRMKRCVRKKVKEKERNITHNRWPVDLQFDWPADVQGLVRYEQVSLPPEPLPMRLTLQ